LNTATHFFACEGRVSPTPVCMRRCACNGGEPRRGRGDDARARLRLVYSSARRDRGR
jgi:hypothetical protein